MTRLLLPIDFSECSSAAVDAVLAQFAPPQTDVRLFHVVNWEDELPASHFFAQGPNAARDLLRDRDRILAERHAHLADLEATFRRAGFAVSGHIHADDRPADAVVRLAQDWPADLIVMGSHGRSGFNRLVFGSVAMEVMRRAPCAVQVVRRAATVPAASRTT
jgi:nucleotide-binding universal stress UspA family protein